MQRDKGHKTRVVKSNRPLPAIVANVVQSACMIRIPTIGSGGNGLWQFMTRDGGSVGIQQLREYGMGTITAANGRGRSVW